MKIVAISLAVALLAACAAAQGTAQAPAAAVALAPAPASAGNSAGLTLDSTISQIAHTSAGRALLEREYPGLADGAVVQDIRFRTIANSIGITEQKLNEIDAELRAIQR